MPKSRHATAIFSPSNSRAMNFRRSSMGLHTFQGILRSPQKARLCYPCLRNELSPLSQEGQLISNIILVHVFSLFPVVCSWFANFVRDEFSKLKMACSANPLVLAR